MRNLGVAVKLGELKLGKMDPKGVGANQREGGGRSVQPLHSSPRSTPEGDLLDRDIEMQQPHLWRSIATHQHKYAYFLPSCLL